ncbi:Hypothetical protein LLA12_00259 [Lactococcus lactis subsp. lactis]|nr:Hypothetical protein LLA12_00259 [Lactococcus lactis subsp. lactis]
MIIDNGVRNKKNFEGECEV